MTDPLDFEARRRRGLLDHRNDQASPEDALALALDQIRAGEIDAHAVVIAIETEDGDLQLISARATYAGMLWILERAKLTVLS